MSELLSAKAAAIELGTDARTLRKFLRQRNGLVGQGQRWEIDPEELDQLRADFSEWSTKLGSKKKGKSKATEAEELPEMEELEDEYWENLDDLEEPEEAELEELDFDD